MYYWQIQIRFIIVREWIQKQVWIWSPFQDHFKISLNHLYQLYSNSFDFLHNFWLSHSNTKPFPSKCFLILVGQIIVLWKFDKSQIRLTKDWLDSLVPLNQFRTKDSLSTLGLLIGYSWSGPKRLELEVSHIDQSLCHTNLLIQFDWY